jgi:hypothetical protein
MRTLTFTLDTQTGDDGMAPATLTISETENGALSFTVTNVDDGDNLIGDIRGVFFDVSDDALINTLNATGDDVTEIDDSGSVSNLGGGVTTSGVPDSPYEVGIEIGTSGISTDDIQTTTFELSSSLRDLTLDDIALESFTVRQTSVSDDNGGREDSDKLYGDAPYPVNAIDDVVSVDEDAVASGNVFANDIDDDAGDVNGDGIPDGLTVTAVGGDPASVAQPFALDDGVTMTIDADGSYTVDAINADYLSVGETLEHTVTYSVDDGNGGSDTASITVTVHGVNDDPLANPDTNTTDEASGITGNVLTNDSDIDRLDTIAVSAVNGETADVGTEITLNSGALLTLNADGTYSYDPNGAFDELNTGENAIDSFDYTIADGNGGFSTTTVEIAIEGIGDGGGGGGDDDDHFGTFLNKKGTAEHDISNVVFYLEEQDGDIIKVKVDGWDSGESDLDNVDIFSFLGEEFSDAGLVAVSIKAGNNHNKDLGPGEGQLFLLDGDEDIDYEQGGNVPEPLTIEILGAHADMTYQYNDDLFL